MWKRLTHPNIVPIIGVTSTPLQLVSEWMTGGGLTEYIKKNPDADRLVLVGGSPIVFPRAHSRFQLSDVAEGLCYLHSHNVIHGDLKGVRRGSDSRFGAVLTCT